ncbi:MULTISPECIES: ParB/Srx family N-terminal domain-containing protein [unclassified Variovorax]|uniref:ParB/Srx family N-terminal domain-containing protein n=1 Tax=unclassified Variovorax TaxID=663243 RepID=UPI00076DA11C|nr:MULTISPECIES: ParB/Srx family N-terminal domain-containing protein [unclassified Variovorax]KWT87441.1 ParB-like partition protein [Variovorax sp. WDL1]PNG45943.1 Nucleoid occlusion protein [Variovorax sp. B2]PNG46171.1 Nucleoid occlusion protein [Variovorax sp. B4]VTV19301.1 ParB/RepB/Spo0J family partition protein [Variovorax sp. WDL1]
MTVIAKPRKIVVSRARKPAALAEAATPAHVEPMGRDVLVPLDKLFVGEANVRKVHHEEGLIELAALIEAQGLLQRLSVVAHPEGRFAVVAGGRRLRAMQILVASGRWQASQPIECKLYDEDQAVQVSLAENSGRESMLGRVLRVSCMSSCIHRRWSLCRRRVFDARPGKLARARVAGR